MNLQKLLVFLAAFLLLSNQSFAAKKPNIMVIATGGTIAGTASTADQSQYSPAQLLIKKILASVTGVSEIANIDSMQFSQISSQDMNDRLWLNLSRTVNELLDKSSVDGIVITHGSDTMEETAYFLNLTVKSKKPVILVGSMRPASSLSADGPLNLYNAIAVAADSAASNKGIMIVLNDNIYAARDVSKVHTSNADAFRSTNFGPIGNVYYGKTRFYYNPIRLHTANSVFDVRKLEELPRVDIVYGYANQPHSITDNLIEEGVKGIVYAGVGDGNIYKDTLQNLIKASASKKVIIARSSRTGSGFVVRNAEISDDQYGFVTTDNLNPQKARILLMLALTKSKDAKEIQELFWKY